MHIKLKFEYLAIAIAFIALAKMVTGETQIQEFFMKTYVANRFAHTSVESKCVNTLDHSTIVSFAVFLPEQAFISNFYLSIDDKRHQSIVTMGQKTNNVPNGTVYRYASVRNSHKVGIDLWVDPQSKVLFHLDYEQLMEKVGGRYEITTNIIPGSLVPKLEVEVVINETGFLELKRDPFIRSTVAFLLIPEIDLQLEQEMSNTSAVIRFRPNIPKQLELVCAGLRNEAFEGLSGQLVVQFDVKMENEGGMTLAGDQFFISFFSPNELQPMPKHVVFILDVSGSMQGERLEYLKKAMYQILPQLWEEDLFDIVEFNGRVYVWRTNQEGNIIRKTSVPEKTRINDYGRLDNYMRGLDLPNFSRATAENIERTINTLKYTKAYGRTNSMGSLETGLFLVKSVQEVFADQYLPIIVFLTDGEPSIGILNEQEIVRKITAINQNGSKAPIYSVAFGNDVNWKFLQALSLGNGARPIKIDIADDTVEQLELFYKEISEPYLTDVHFNNIPVAADITKSKFPIFFKGSELMIAGRGDSSSVENMSTSARDRHGQRNFHPQVAESDANLERIWANLMLSQLIDQFYATENANFSHSAHTLAKEQSLVTEFTSLVVHQMILNTKDGMRKYLPEPAKDPPFCSNVSAYIMEHYPITIELPETTTTEAPETTTTEVPETTTTEVPETTTTEAPETTTTEVISKIQKCSERGKSCEGGVEKWFFNRLKGRCMKFNGCNDFFDNEEDCEDICIRAVGKERCELPVSLGGFKSFTNKWFYVKRRNSCVEYEYGGTYGNTNRFDTKQECSELCVS